MAIQCHKRGWNRLAQYLIEFSQNENEREPQQHLIHIAWDYWSGHVTKPEIDRAPVAKRLQELIRRDQALDTDLHRALLKSLELALVPSKAKPGSIQALIDDLVDYQSDTGTPRLFKPEDRYWRIAKLGFEVVPALIEHLEDDRLTRAMMTGFNNFPSWHLRVQHVVGDLLEELAAEELMRGQDGEDVGGGWLRRQQGYSITKAAATEWWNKAQLIGEEKYLLEHVLPDINKGRNAHISEHLVKLIELKYPHQLPSVYEKVLTERPELHSSMLAHALLQSKTDDRRKLSLFLRAAQHNDCRHRLPAFHALRDLDKKQFTSLIIDAIENLPVDVSGEYWYCPEAHIAKFAMDVDDPSVWKTLESVARRSVLGMRMEILHQFGDPKDTRRRIERLRLLSSFMDDAEMRDVDVNEKLGGPGAGFPYHKIEVRDFVSLEIARMIGIEIELKLDRTKEEWSDIRKRMREALNREFRITK